MCATAGWSDKWAKGGTVLPVPPKCTHWRTNHMTEVWCHSVQVPQNLLKPRVLASRIRWCLTMLARVTADPSMIYHIVFCDESTFVLHGLSKHSVQVYCSAGAARPSDVCYISDKTIKPIKVHFFLAVTAHGEYEDDNGVVLYEECSGTTDIDRRANKQQDGSEMTGKQEYWVSVCMLFVIQKQMLPCQLS